MVRVRPLAVSAAVIAVASGVVCAGLAWRRVRQYPARSPADADRRAGTGRVWLEPARVEGTSMLPSLPPGARVAVAPVPDPNSVGRGQLVVVGATALPAGLGLPPQMVKRVVGLPGEHVRVDAAGLWVDGRPVPEPYRRPPRRAGHRAEGRRGDRTGNRAGDRPAQPGPTVTEPFEVRLGLGEYLVLGDRRDASTDGRTFGPVRLDDLDGIVRFAYWPVRSLVATLRGRGFWHHAWRTRIPNTESGGQRHEPGRSIPQS